MTKLTRAEFLGRAVTGFSLTLASRHGSAAAIQPDSSSAPDLILLNGRIYTVDDAMPRAEAFAIQNERFVAVGRSDDIRGLRGPRTEVIDAEGMSVTPGFIDAHCHPRPQELLEVDLDLRSIADIKAALRAKAADTPAGEWVLGFKYDDTKVQDGRFITRRDLDEAVPEHPVRINHRGGHVAWYNSRAFELAGVTAETPDPPLGKYYREAGELTGMVSESGRDVFKPFMPPGATREQQRQAVTLNSEKMTAAGLTSIHDAGCQRESFVAYQDAYRKGEMRFRVYLLARPAVLAGLRSAGIQSGFGDDWLRIGGAKYTADGAASGRTMRMSTPYVGRPDDYGILAMTQQEIHEVVEDAHRHDFQVGIHANGDVAIDMVLNAYERVQELWPRPDTRHRIEHCTLVNPSLLRRIRAIGAVVTPFYTYLYHHGDKWSEYGDEKMRWMFAHRSFFDYGIIAAGGSDYVSGPYEPLLAIQSMVTRRDFTGRVWGENQRISVDEALRVCTVNGAYASFEEDRKGSITPGKLADFVMLAEDPHEVDPDRIRNIEVARTVVGGRTMYAGSGSA